MSATSELLRALRATGLSQTEISRRTGIPQPRLSRWENEAPDSADDALKIRALHDELVTAEHPAPAEPATAKAA